MLNIRASLRWSLVTLCALCLAGRLAVADSLQDDYLVFFPSGQAEIGAQQEVTVEQAAQAIKRAYSNGYDGQISVDGHTDAVEENVALSKARAEIVRDLLVQLGVPASHITVSAYGDMKLLVKTQPVVPVAQNRRAEISFMRARRR